MSSTETEAAVFLGPELAGTLMTSEEFDAVEEADENYVYELINGILVVSPPPLEGERGANEELGYLLRLYRQHHPQGSSLDATLREHLIRTRSSRRRADRVIWAGLQRQPHPRRDRPTIAVEFVSKGKRNRKRDYLEKKKEFLAAGIMEYWVIDRFARVMTVYRKGKSELVVAENKTYSTPLLPGFVLPLARLLETADRWEGISDR
jgi:Uma2 family endonuclease